jgi:hypothetical protein
VACADGFAANEEKLEKLADQLLSVDPEIINGRIFLLGKLGTSS